MSTIHVNQPAEAVDRHLSGAVAAFGWPRLECVIQQQGSIGGHIEH